MKLLRCDIVMNQECNTFSFQRQMVDTKLQAINSLKPPDVGTGLKRKRKATISTS